MSLTDKVNKDMKVIQKLIMGLIIISLFNAPLTLAAEKVSKIRVLGMYCQACANGLKASLSPHKGVNGVQIDFAGRASKPSLVTMIYDDEKITEVKLRDLIRESGFKLVAEKKKK